MLISMRLKEKKMLKKGKFCPIEDVFFFLIGEVVYLNIYFFHSFK